jgi:hypothetical protein
VSSLAGVIVTGVRREATSAEAPAAQAASPVVGSWAINARGSKGTLKIVDVDASGNLDPSSTLGADPIVGFFD